MFSRLLRHKFKLFISCISTLRSFYFQKVPTLKFFLPFQLLINIKIIYLNILWSSLKRMDAQKIYNWSILDTQFMCMKHIWKIYFTYLPTLFFSDCYRKQTNFVLWICIQNVSDTSIGIRGPYKPAQLNKCGL